MSKSIAPQPTSLRLTPLIGRGKLLAQARNTVLGWLKLDQAGADDAASTTGSSGGRNCLLLIAGDAAVGKSRFAYELLQSLSAKINLNTSVVHFSPNTSYSMFAAEALQVAQLNPSNLEQRWEQLCVLAERAAGDEFGARRRQHLPLLRRILDNAPLAPAGLQGIDADGFPAATTLAVRACCELTGVSTGNPIIMIMEDLQWMGSKRSLLVDLLHHVSLPLPLIVVATARPEFDCSPEELSSLVGSGVYEILKLPPLNRTEGGRLIQALLPGIQLSPAALQSIELKAEGLPFYYEKSARLLQLIGAVSEHDGQYALLDEARLSDLPSDISGLIMRGLQLMNSDLRDLAGQASVIGQAFSENGLSQLCSEAAGISQESAGQRLLKLQDLLTAEPGGNFRFQHGLIQETIYQSIPLAEKQQLHALMAESLEEVAVPGTAAEWDTLPELVRHLAGSGQYATAHRNACALLRLMVQTGHLAAWEETLALAIRLWNLDDSPADGKKQRLPGKDPDGFPPSALLQLAIGERHWRRGCYDEAEKHTSYARVLAHAAGQQQAESKALNCLGLLHLEQGRFDEARNCLVEAVAICHETGDTRSEAAALNNFGSLLYNQGLVDEAQDKHERAAELYRQHGNRRGLASALNNLGNPYFVRGQLETARDCYTEALRLFREVSDYRGTAYALVSLGNLEYVSGSINAAQASYKEAAAIHGELSDQRMKAFALINLGSAEYFLGQMDKARQHFSESISIGESLGDHRVRQHALNGLGLVLHCWGQLYRARDIYLESLALCEENHDQVTELEVLYNLGCLELDRGHLEEAERCLCLSLENSRELGQRRFEASNNAALGYLCLIAGKTKEAAGHLDQALQLAREISDRISEAESLYAQGYLNILNADLVQAALDLEASLVVSREAGAAAAIGLAAVHLSRVYAWQGRLVHADSMLETAASVTEDAADALKQGLLHCSRGYYQLAAAGFIPESQRNSKGANPEIVPLVSAESAYRAYGKAVAAARQVLRDTDAGANSELAGEIRRLGDAGRAFAALHDLSRYMAP